jgi:hypothetical protein
VGRAAAALPLAPDRQPDQGDPSDAEQDLDAGQRRR